MYMLLVMMVLKCYLQMIYKYEKEKRDCSWLTFRFIVLVFTDMFQIFVFAMFVFMSELGEEEEEKNKIRIFNQQNESYFMHK